MEDLSIKWIVDINEELSLGFKLGNVVHLYEAILIFNGLYNCSYACNEEIDFNQCFYELMDGVQSVNKYAVYSFEFIQKEQRLYMYIHDSIDNKNKQVNRRILHSFNCTINQSKSD